MVVWIVVGVVVVVVVGFIVWLVVGGGKIGAEHKARFENGTRATATIDKVEQPGSSQARPTLVARLHVTVTPPEGEPYQAVTGVRIKTVDVPKVQEGETLSVRIARDNPQLVYPDVEWAEMELVTITRAARGDF